MKHVKKTKTRINPTNQSYDHMQGDINNPADHPAASMPDPMGGAYDGSQLPAPPGMQESQPGSGGI